MDHDFHDIHECKSWMKKNHQIICSLIDETQNEGQNVAILARTQLFRWKIENINQISIFTSDGENGLTLE